MNIPVLTQLVALIEELIKAHGSEVAQAAAVAAEGAAMQSAQVDPKTQAVTAASFALLQAAQSLKSAIQTPPPPTA